MEMNKKILNEFNDAYVQALEEGESEFTFKGERFYTPYAKYLIEYLRTKL